VTTKSEAAGCSTAYEMVEHLAQRLCREADPTSVWAAEDEITRLYYRRQAQQKLAAEVYTDSRIPS